MLFNFSLQAQNDYKPGFIVTASNDTLRGWVNNLSETTNSKKCFYKPSPQTDSKEFAPDEINGYGFLDGKVYESKEISLDSIRKKGYFLEILASGDISLFHLKINNTYYVEKKSSGFYELKQIKQEIEKEGERFIVTKDLYKGIFHFLMADCQSVKKKIDKVDFMTEALISLVEEYNTCMNPTLSIKSKRKFITLKAGILAGLGQGKLQMESLEEPFNYLNEIAFQAKARPVAGMYLQTTLPWVIERVSLWIESQYTTQSFTGYGEYKTDTDKGHQFYEKTLKGSATIKVSYLHLPFMLRYTYPKGKIRPFVQSGIGFNFSLKKYSHLEVATQTHWETTTMEREPILFRDRPASLLAGIGIEHRVTKKLRYYAEIRGHMSNRFAETSTTTPYKAHTKGLSLYIGLGL